MPNVWLKVVLEIQQGVYNSTNESANARIKEKSNYKWSDLPDVFAKMKEFVSTQMCDTEQVFNTRTGLYMVTKWYPQVN